VDTYGSAKASASHDVQFIVVKDFMFALKVGVHIIILVPQPINSSYYFYQLENGFFNHGTLIPISFQNHAIS
jgi:hypothetical protein